MRRLLEKVHRIQTRPVEGSVRVELDGEVLAESTRALRLDERGLPPRYYLPREDVQAELLPSAKRTHCPFKGDATHFSLRCGDSTHDAIAWSYEAPIESVAQIKDLVAFYDDRVSVTLA